MKCPACQFVNPEGAKFCNECGSKLELACPECGKVNPVNSKFCNECGYNLRESEETLQVDDPDQKLPPSKGTIEEIPAIPVAIEGERKYVTALFSDMSGYTAMSERLDPEEVKEITSGIFNEISKIVSKYDGFIEKFIGDAVMALFGVPKTHVDDPLRAIKAAREIHDLVKSVSPELEKKIGKPLSMHTGINTGLVVTGEVDMEKGTHGVAGDTINVAARLSNLAEADQIIAGPDTYRQGEGFFAFEALEPTLVKGKKEPIQIYKILSPKELPSTTHRYHGLRADLIGRQVELTQLVEAAENLRKGKGAIFSICGETGIGKTRLVEEFKAALDLGDIQWLDGQAYAYSQNTPYFPLIDLFNRGFQINEGDPPEKVKEKIESGVEVLIGKREDVIGYVGSLYSLRYPAVEDISPEFWKSRLKEAIHTILSGLAQKASTIICLEDLHWADPSFMELLRFVLTEFRYPALFICVYRPTISLFTSHQLSGLKAQYREILLHDLSLSEAQAMLESLLDTKEIPKDMKRYIRENVGGNPFYLEEVVNALIESKTIIRNHGTWRLNRLISQIDMPSTIHGIIAARLDRLGSASKRILQEASVIGRSFLYDILKNCTNLQEQLDKNLIRLERLDLIHARSLQPELEYVFKSALTQEVVYNGLLKRERQTIHEQIAQVIEQLFEDRLPEFYEALAFHFHKGLSTHKAVDYLVKSGEKSLARYSVEEAHQYFRKAFEILSSKKNKSQEEKIILIDILNSWGYAFYYLGNIKEFINLFDSHKDLAESLDDKARIGMFYVWFGVALFMAGKPKDSYDCLSNALELGEISSNQKVVGYACTWLTWACAELGLLEQGVGFGERAQTIAELFPSDQYLFFKSLGGLCYINNMKGDSKKVFEGAKLLLSHSEKTSNNRSKVFGYWTNSWGHLLTGNMELAQKNAEKAVETALDPFYALFPKISLGLAYFFSGQFQKVEDVLQSALGFCEKYEIGQLSELSYLSLASALISKGHMKQGLRMLEKSQENLIRNHRKVWYAQSEKILGTIYSQIATGPTPAFSVMAKNIGFLVKNAPFAVKKAEEHLNKAIDIFKEIGSKGFLGTAYLELGLLYKNRKRIDQARNYLLEAIDIFEETEAKVYLKRTREVLESLQ